MTALQQFNDFADRRKALLHPNVPAPYIPRSRFTDKDANSLTKAIIACIELHGGYAVRINTQGQYNEQLGQWTKGNTRKGTADIHAIYNGRHLSIEVKIGRDRISKEQKDTADRVTQAGGMYFVASSFESFWLWLNSIDQPSCLVLTEAQTTALLRVLLAAIPHFRQEVEKGTPAIGLINYDLDLHNAERLFQLVNINTLKAEVR